jgi:hypothetical protein
VSTGAPASITDNNAKWVTNFWREYTFMITSGTASGQNFIITSNTATLLSGAYLLGLTPASGDAYSIFWGGMLVSTVSTGSNITLQDNNANWPINYWANGYRCMITAGVASGANFGVSGNSANTLSGWNIFAIVPASGDKYQLFQGTGIFSGYYPSGYLTPYAQEYTHCAQGCYERNNIAQQETGITLSGGNSIRFFGAGVQDFNMPVSGATNLSVWSYYDDFYSGTLPQMIIKNGSGIGIADNTGVLNVGSGVWGQISLSVTGTSAGIITVQFRSNATGTIGAQAYFDAFSTS